MNLRYEDILFQFLLLLIYFLFKQNNNKKTSQCWEFCVAAFLFRRLARSILTEADQFDFE